MERGYYKVYRWGAIVDGVILYGDEYKEFVREILYMMLMDGEVPIYPLWDGEITTQKIEHALRASKARILRAAGWKRAE